MAWIRLSHVNVRSPLSKICQPCPRYDCHVQWRGLAEFTDNHYDVLGLKPSATQSQIKSAYYQLSKKYHPDVAIGVNNAKDKFTKLSTAYEVLGSPEKRAVYDRSLYSGVHGRATFKPDIEYREFMQRRGSFQRKTSNKKHAHADPSASFVYEEHFKQRYYGGTVKQNWQACRNFDYRRRQNRQGGHILVLWVYLMFTGMLIFGSIKID